ncbi:MAG TPA: MMPL family transporter, partial [Gemmataceae bacterium]|nr:MMPL family transporter [Gemmataceae bacterium]
MFKHFSRRIVDHPWLVCGAWLAVIATVTWLAPGWQSNSQDDDIRFLPAKSASVRALHILEQAFPQDVYASRLLLAVERTDAPLTLDDFRVVDRATAEIQALMKEEPGLPITSVTSWREPLIGNRLVSNDKQCTLISVSLGTPYLALQTQTTVDRIEERVRPLFADQPGLKLHVTGPAGVGRDLVRASVSSLDQTTVATVLLVVLVLVVVYRSPFLAVIPLLTIGVATWVSLKLLALASWIPGVQLVNISQVFMIVILFGTGTDYCLFLMARYQEELEAGQPAAPALRFSLGSVAGALVASAATVMAGLGLMGFAEFRKISCAGPVMALSLAVALIASLTLSPALLRLFGKAIFWPRRFSPAYPRATHTGIWHKISQWVVRHPKLVLGLAAVSLLPLAVFGLQVRSSFKPTGDLSPNARSVRGMAVTQRHFPAGETGPITVLLVSDADWNSPEGREAIQKLSQCFQFLDHVEEVRSLTQPLGMPVPDMAVAKPDTSRKPLNSLLDTVKKEMGGVLANSLNKARAFYVAKIDTDQGPRYVTRLDVVLKCDPFEADSVQTLEIIEAWLRNHPPAGAVQCECYGVTVHTRDMSQVIERDRLRVNTLVLIGVFAILMIVVRRPWLALYLLATVLLSYYATLGATALFAHYWAGKPLGQVEWRVPFFLFTILIAIGEDYNILMVSRVLQERRRWGPREGLRRGLARTGGTITACGVIMAGTFGTLMLGHLGTLVQIGFALGLGVLLDTFVV